MACISCTAVKYRMSVEVINEIWYRPVRNDTRLYSSAEVADITLHDRAQCSLDCDGRELSPLSIYINVHSVRGEF